MPSFSTKIKEEILRKPVRNRRSAALLFAGLTYTCGGIRIGSSPFLVYKTELEALANYIAKYAAQFYQTDTQTELRHTAWRKTPLYRVALTGEGIYPLLEESGLATRDAEGSLRLRGMGEGLSAAGQKSFLQGCFLGSGVCGNPNSVYRAEILFRSEAAAAAALQMLQANGLSAAITERREQALLYLNDADNVAGLLALLGYSAGVFEIYNTKAEKTLRNNENRRENCDAANADKALTAAARQVYAIQTIQKQRGLHTLPASLRTAAALRLENPYATLPELALIEGIGKSGMNHRLARLIELAAEMEV
ncbi:MAG: DNA-binding protein WhiA [Clostridiales bacterium]|nr:DNA-binding protein WhiA [Clostridiales bacterium]